LIKFATYYKIIVKISLGLLTADITI